MAIKKVQKIGIRVAHKRIWYDRKQRFKGEKMIRKLLKNKNGLSLLEILVGMVIFSLGLLILIPMSVTSIRGNEYANMMTKATQLAQAKLEELKNTSVLSSGSDNILGMSRTWTVESASSNLKKFTIEVVWNESNGKQHKTTTITYQAKND
jgi:prepilin-type N-terminal cleavage/methylation domain-containing protein